MFLARGFGMRVVGGKTGTDGRLFAYVVWTVPGGPAEKHGLQQGDKVNHPYTFQIFSASPMNTRFIYGFCILHK